MSGETTTPGQSKATKGFRDQLRVIAVFAGHILMASFVFCVVGAGALVVHLARHYFESSELDPLILYGMHGIEWLMFACGFAATAFWSIISTYRTLRELKEE